MDDYTLELIRQLNEVLCSEIRKLKERIAELEARPLRPHITPRTNFTWPTVAQWWRFRPFCN